MKRILAVILAVVLAPSAAYSGKVKVWHHHAAAHHDKAAFKDAVVSSEGTLQLARRLKPLLGVEATHVWALAEDASGNLFVATGNEGKLFKITSTGEVSVAFHSEDSQILSLAAAPDGTIYAGTGPSGLIVRIAPDGNTRVLHDSPEAYVWALALDKSGENVFAATGPRGRIYKLDKEGKATVFYTTKQDHVLCLALAPDGHLYAGTSRTGLVYRIDPQGKGFVVFDAPQTEIKTLLVGKDAVYAGTSSPTSRQSASAAAAGSGSRSLASADSSDAVNRANIDLKRDGETKERSANTPTTPSGSGTPTSGASSPSSASPPAAGENSVYRIAADGSAREIFREKAMVLSLLERGERLLVATGGDGQLFEIAQTSRERSQLVRIDHSQIHCLLARKDGSIVLGAGDPGKLYVLEDQFTSKGAVTSEVLDAKSISRWGTVRWQSDTPAGTRITLATRSGNVAEPDETWSDWSEEQTDGANATVTAPSARYLQYRVTLGSESGRETPKLDRLAIRYQPANLAPEVLAIDVPDLDAVNLDNPKKLKIKWRAADPNDDELTYRLYYRKEGWKTWVELEEDLDKLEHEWDTTTAPAGVYQLKVVAGDRKDNPDEQAQVGERISAPFIIDHVPPKVELKVAGFEGDRAIIEVKGEDALTRLTSASYSVDSKKWMNVFPSDGLFDAKAETFRFKTEELKPGTHVLVLRLTDAAGNTGSADVVFQVEVRTASK
jgi:hypothetical protein